MSNINIRVSTINDAETIIRFQNEMAMETEKKTLNEDKDSIRRPEITTDAAISKLILKLKKPADAGVKSSDESIKFKDILEIYVPIYEARLIGPKKRVKILRIDAVRKKIL